mgnify:CR=1 FL=1
MSAAVVGADGRRGFSFVGGHDGGCGGGAEGGEHADAVSANEVVAVAFGGNTDGEVVVFERGCAHSFSAVGDDEAGVAVSVAGDADGDGVGGVVVGVSVEGVGDVFAYGGEQFVVVEGGDGLNGEFVCSVFDGGVYDGRGYVAGHGGVLSTQGSLFNIMSNSQ